MTATLMYCAEVEVDRRKVDDAHLEVIVDALQHYHPAVGISPRGFLVVKVSFPAVSLNQAATTALATVQVATLASPFRLEVMTEDEFNARQGFVEMPDLIGAAEAGQLLGVTRQRVQQLVDQGKLPGRLIGRSLVFSRAEVQAFRASSIDSPPTNRGQEG